MSELAPGTRIEVLRDQRLGGGYAHVNGLLEILARNDRAEAGVDTAPPDTDDERRETSRKEDA